MQKKKQETTIEIAGIDVPIHNAWHKIEVLHTAADLLESLNDKYPQLASEFTCSITPIIRERISNSIGDAKMPPKADVDLVEFLVEKLEQGEEPQTIIEQAHKEKGVEISLEDLVYLVGDKTYSDAMTRQAKVFADNQISPDQTAELWNQAQLPAPGKELWSKSDVEQLLGIHESNGWD